MRAPFELLNEGVRLRVRLQPNASSNRVDGIYGYSEDCRIKTHVTTVPEKGKANKTLLKLLAKFLGCPVSQLTLIKGQADKNKTILVTGNADPVVETLSNWFAKECEKDDS